MKSLRMDLSASERDYCARCRKLAELVKIRDQLICVPCWRVQIYLKLKHNI